MQIFVLNSSSFDFSNNFLFPKFVQKRFMQELRLGFIGLGRECKIRIDLTYIILV